MAQTRTYYRSFAGGEVSPEMFGRIDDVKFQTGAAKMLNFIALPQGPAENRPGTKFVLEVKDSTKRTRLIPFTFSTTQTVVIELGAGYFRFHTQGATILSGGVPYEVANPYAEADLFDIHYVQSADVLTLVHPNYAPRELRRVSVTSWTLTTITFGASISTPAAPTVTATAGQGINITNITQANPGHITVANDAKDKTLSEGDSIYVSGVGGMTQINNQFYVIDTFHAADKFSVTNYQTGVKLNTTAFSAYTSGGIVQAMEQTQSVSNSYVITAVASNGIDETPASSPTSATNNLNVVGSYNTVSWVAITGAARYNVYKLQSGLYGYIGQSETTSFVDNNIAPDMGITPPIPETVFASTNNYPAAVSYFEQRRVFAGTNNAPQTLWMTRTSTESDMSYHIPLQDTDRINFRVAAREANTIRHLVPLTQLLALTSAAEWRISPVNSDVITPTTISVRPQSYVGANNVQPSIVNNTVVYCSARDGHVRELGYSWQASGFITGDLSLRSTHLFDGLDIVDMCYSKAPHPLLWFISSSGTMLGLTYIPEQQIAAWHQHDTDGAFESCTAVAEGAEDALYVIVARNIGGTVKRYVERFQTRQVDNLEDCFFVDSGLTYDGNNSTATTVTVTGGTLWTPAEVLTITASGAIFQFPATTDVGDVIVLTNTDGEKYRLTILGTTSTTVATVRVDRTLPAPLRNVATATWAFARDTVSGLTHLEGKTVSILADGAVMPQVTVTGGTAALQRPAALVHVGLPYNSDLQTLPMTLQVDGFGQGRVKNVNEAWLRVFRSSGIFIGPSADKLVEAKQRTTEPYGSPPGLKTEEVGSKLTPTWQSAGSVYVRQSDPLPLTIVGLTLEVSIGD
jgi:hypothetical protein